MIFSVTDSAAISPTLYAEAFGMSAEEASADIAALTEGGALPLTLSNGGVTLTQGFALPLIADGLPLLYLYALATLPAARGQGHLRTLLERAADYARGAGYRALVLLPANEALAEAYTRMGFTETRTAGGAAALGRASDLTYLCEGEGAPVPIEVEECLPPLGGALPAPLLAFAIRSLAPAVLPYRVGESICLLLATDLRHALCADRCHAIHKTTDRHRLLLRPLGGRLPEAIPEPLPR